MPTIERRITVLEGQAGNASTISKVMLVCLRDDETQEDALARMGCNPDDPKSMCILLVPLSKNT